LVAKIRKSTLEDIIPLSEYQYDFKPLIDTQGSFVRINSLEQFENFAEDLRTLQQGEKLSLTTFANQWFEFMKFRQIRYVTAEKSVSIEYQI